jgi:hypothetical protein
LSKPLNIFSNLYYTISPVLPNITWSEWKLEVIFDFLHILIYKWLTMKKCKFEYTFLAPPIGKETQHWCKILEKKLVQTLINVWMTTRDLCTLSTLWIILRIECLQALQIEEPHEKSNGPLGNEKFKFKPSLSNLVQVLMCIAWT